MRASRCCQDAGWWKEIDKEDGVIGICCVSKNGQQIEIHERRDGSFTVSSPLGVLAISPLDINCITIATSEGDPDANMDGD